MWIFFAVLLHAEWWMQWFTADFLHLASAFVSPRQVGKVHRHCFPYTCVFNPNQLWRHKIIKMLIHKNIRRKNKCLHPVYCLFWGGSSSFNQPLSGKYNKRDRCVRTYRVSSVISITGAITRYNRYSLPLKNIHKNNNTPRQQQQRRRQSSS